MAIDTQTKLFIWGGAVLVTAVVALGTWKVVSRQRAATTQGPTVYAYVRANAQIDGEQVSFVVFSELPEASCEGELPAVFERTLGQQHAWKASVTQEEGECIEELPSRYQGLFENVTLSNPYAAFVERDGRETRETRIVVWGAHGEKARRICRELESDLENRLGVPAKTVAQ